MLVVDFLIIRGRHTQVHLTTSTLYHGIWIIVSHLVAESNLFELH